MQSNELDKYWQQAIDKYRNENSNDLFIVEVVEPTKLINVIQNEAIVGVNNSDHFNFLENIKSKLETILSSFMKKNINIKFVDIADKDKYVSVSNNVPIKDTGAIGLDKSIYYSSYVVGDFNKDAFRLANQLSETSSSTFNPIFIYSKTGLGKTHLLTAMVNEFEKKYPNKKIHYVESQTFIREVFSCFEEKNNSSLIENLKNRYCEFDVLVIDDIQYLADKNKTNEILFTIFNNLTQKKKTIIMTSDRGPHELNGFEDRMISRFSSGISCRICEPDNESLKIIISKVLNEQNIYLTNEAMMLIVDFCDRDIRKLLGLVNKIIFFVDNKNNLLDKDNIKNILEIENKVIGYNKKNTFAHPSIIMEKVAKIYNIKISDLRDNSRKKNVATARHLVMFIMREHAKLQLKDIGGFLGNRDHTTVLNGVEKIKSLINSDKEFSKVVNSIIKKLS